MELLSPAGNFDSMKAAVQNGADAVYMGAAEFNARRFAGNFEEIAPAVSYAHLRGCDVHLTLNTLLNDRDISHFLQTAASAAEAGVDAFIVQDLGALSILQQTLPNVPLHASTQMTIHNIDGARKMQELGFARVVLARELSYEQICEIRQHTQIELETFVHGALCVCYSGQCLMSSMLGGRSANRGVCAQPCRLQYASDDNKGYLLSPKDLCLVGEINKLRNAGVDSIKIEGRMKRPEYVAAVTQIYRKAVDNLPVTRQDMETLLLAFNRGGFTSGLFAHEQDRLYPLQPDNLGLPIGKVVSVAPRSVSLRTKRRLRAGDEIAPALPDASKHKITKVEVRRDCTVVSLGDASAFAPGMTVSLITDAEQFSKLSATISANARRTTVCATIYIAPHQKPTLTITTGDVSVRVESPAEAESAKNRALTTDDVRRQLQKTGDFPFVLDSITVNLSDATAFPLSGLNALRRDALTAIESAILARYPTHIRKPYAASAGKPTHTTKPLLAAQVRTKEQLFAVLPYADVLYIPIDADFRQDIPSDIPTIGVYPHIASDGELSKLKQYETEFNTVMMSGFLDSNKQKTSDFGMNILNSEALFLLSLHGFCRATLSPELNTAQINVLRIPDGMQTEVIAYGRHTLMITAHCPLNCRREHCAAANGAAFITDRKGISFPVIRIGEACRVSILNSLPVYMADRLNGIHAHVLRMVFTIESPQECTRIASIYRAATEGKPVSFDGAYTRGHFSRGVQV